MRNERQSAYHRERERQRAHDRQLHSIEQANRRDREWFENEIESLKESLRVSEEAASNEAKATAKAKAKQVPLRPTAKATAEATSTPKAALERIWTYVDGDAIEQGPYSEQQMADWFREGFMHATLPIRCENFRALRDVFPPPLLPFQSDPR